MLTDKNLSDIADGKLLVDRDLLLEMIHSMLYAIGPTTSLEEVEEFQDQCISLAQESWLELLFDILLYPPTEFNRFEGDGWDAMIWMLLGSAAEKFPQTGLEVALRYFPGDRERIRAAVINTLGSTSLSDSFSYVDSYFGQLSRLTPDEMLRLVVAYSDIGGERCVERLKEIVNSAELEQWEEGIGVIGLIDVECGLSRAAAKTTGSRD